MDGSEIDSQGRESKIETESSPIPPVITDQYFEEIQSKCLLTIKSLQSNQNISAADDFLLLVNICQQLRTNVDTETQNANKFQIEIDSLNFRYDNSLEEIRKQNETIFQLRNEIEQAWLERDAALLREQAAQSHMMTMREKLDQIEKESRKPETVHRDEPGISLTKQKESLLRDRDRLTSEIEKLTKHLQRDNEQIKILEDKRFEYEEKCRELYRLLDETSSEAFKEKRFLDQLRIILSDVTIERNTVSDQLKYTRAQCDSLQTYNVQLNLKLGAVKANLQRMTTQYNVCNTKLSKALAECTEMSAKFDQLQIDLVQQASIVREKDTECLRFAKEIVQVTKERDTALKRAYNIDAQKDELEQQLRKLGNAIATTEKERDTDKKFIEKLKKAAEGVKYERDSIQKDLKRIEKIVNEQRDTIKLMEKNQNVLESEIKNHLVTIQRQSKALAEAERVRDRIYCDSQVNALKVDEVQNEHDFATKEYANIMLKLTETETRLKHTKQKQEMLTAERNTLQKSLETITDDRNVVRDKLRNAAAKQKKLKETLNDKGTELLYANKQIDKLEKEKSTVKADIQNAAVALQHVRTELAEKEHECSAVYKAYDAEQKQSLRLNQRVETLQKEKDLIGVELMKKNDEIRHVNNRLDIMQIALDRSESQYNDRLEDIRLLKIEVANLRSQKQLLTQGVCNTVNMRQEVLQLHRDLTQERIRSKALEEEMTTPMNVHRWRKLAGNDPDKMILFEKIQTLQKRILYQTAICTRREHTLREMNTLYDALKASIERMGNPNEIKKNLNMTRRALTTNNRKLKALSAETLARDQEMKAKDQRIDLMKQELLNKNQIILKDKRHKRKLKTELDAIKSELKIDDRPFTCPTIGQSYRTAGAGFRIPNFE